MSKISRQFGFAGFAVIAVLSGASSSMAQIEPGNRANLLSRGYTPSDFKAAEVTQIGSNFPLYTRWKDCVAQHTLMIVIGVVPPAQAGASLSVNCNDEALTLRAGIARTLGLGQANRVMSLISADAGLTIGRSAKAEADFQASKKKSPSDDVFWREGLWSVRVIRDKKCGAVLETGFSNSDGHQGIKMMVIPTSDNYEIRFVIGQQSSETDFSKLVGKSFKLNSIVASNEYGNSKSRKIDGRYSVMTNNYDIWLSKPLSDLSIPLLTRSDDLQITTVPLQTFAPVRLEVQYAIGELTFILPQIDRCNASFARGSATQ